MVILMPLYLLKLRREIENAKIRKHNSSETLRQHATALKQQISNILKVFEDNVKAGNIDNSDAYVLSGLIEKLYRHLYADIQEFKEEGVTDMVAGKLLVKYEDELIKERKRLREEGRIYAEQMAQQVTQQVTQLVTQQEQKKAMVEKLETVRNLLTMGLSPEDVAKATRLPVEQVRGLTEQAV